MATINDLPFNDTPNLSDSVPIYKTSSGVTQRTSVNQLLAGGLSSLPVVQPVNGSGELWIDPLDGNAIKVAGPANASTASNLTQTVLNLANGTAPDAGTLTGAEIMPLNRSDGLLQTTLTKIAQWVIQTYQGFKQPGTGGVARTVQAELQSRVTVKQFGAVGDGVTDDTSAIQAAINSVGSSGTVRLNASGVYYVAGNLNVNAGVLLRGPTDKIGTPGTGAQTANIWTRPGRIMLNPASTISVYGSGALVGVPVIRSTMAGPENNAAAYTGTAVTVLGDDVQIEGNLIVGFAKAIYSTGSARHFISKNSIDCSNGVHLVSSHDISRVVDNHLWPWGTIGAAAPVSTFDTNHYLYRSGVGYRLDTCDWVKLRGNFSYGPTIGIEVSNCTNPSLIDNSVECIASDTAPYVVGTAGIQIDGTTSQPNLIGNQAVHFTSGIYQNLSASSICHYAGNYVRDFTSSGIAIVVGDAVVTGNIIVGHDNTMGNGIRTVASTNNCIVEHNSLTGCQYGIKIDSYNARIGVNYFSGCSQNVFEVAPTLSIASAATVTLDPKFDLFTITGTTGITSITGTYEGHEVTLIFTGALTVTNGGNLKLASNYTTTADDTLTMVYSGTGYWYEKARSVN